MNLLDIYEQREPYQQAIDRLEQHRIDTLNDRMQELLGRARTASPEMKAALKREFEKIKSERDGYYKIRETQKGQDVVDRAAKMKALTPSKPGAMGAIKDVASGLKNFLQGKPETGPTYEAQKKNSSKVDEHGGGIGPSQRWQDLMPEQSMEEGWSDAYVSRRTGRPRTPYSVYIKGKKWKDFANDDHARAVMDKLKAKFKADGRDPETVTIAPTDIPEDVVEGIRDTASATAVIACLLAGGGLTGCATAPQKTTAQQVLKTGQDIGGAVIAAKRITRAGAEEEVRQELRNLARGMGGQSAELNNSNILRIWRNIKGNNDNQVVNEVKDTEAVEQAILKRIMVQHRDLLVKYGPEKIMNAAEDVAYNVGDIGEIGSSDISGWVRQVEYILGDRP